MDLDQPKHSPSPWEMHQDRPDGFWDIFAGGDPRLHDGPCIGTIRKKEDAHLVVAAPDLLEACRKALIYIEHCVEPSCDEGEELEDGTIHDGSTEEGNLLRAAISKATGQEVPR